MIPIAGEHAGLRYRPEVDGLRAVAVLAVVFFHAGLGVPGGYVGVDVFFVISGYLITSLIAKDLQAGTFSFAGFWARRARRILPALVVVVVAVLALGWVLLLPDDFASLGKAALWQSFFAANFYAWMDTGYFVPAADQKPLLHLWSLAVEEQFYFLFPAFMVAFWGRGPRVWKAFKIVLGAGILASFAFSVFTVAFYKGVAFYWLPSRAWELGLGAALAMMPDRAIPRGGRVRETLAWGGLAAIVASCFLLTDETPFPGLAALPACMGTAAVILACTRTPENPLPVAGRLLALRPVVFVGLISYSFYLWHWPLFAFANYWAFVTPPVWLRLVLAAAGFGLAVLSWKFVEVPVRSSRRAKRPAFVLPLAGAVLATVALLGAGVWRGDGLPGRPIGSLADVASPKFSRNWLVEATPEDVRVGRLFELGNPGGEVSVVLWGDSHAMAAAPAVDRILKNSARTGVMLARSSTPPTPGRYWPNPWATRQQSLEFHAAILDYLEKTRPDLVLLVAAWRSYQTDDAGGEIGPALIDTVKSLRERGLNVAVMLQVPKHDLFIPKAAAISRMSGIDIAPFLSVQGKFSRSFRDLGSLPTHLEEAGAHVIDPLPAFEGGPGGKYAVERDGILLYRDGSHLSEQGAIHMLAPLIEPLFSPSETK